MLYLLLPYIIVVNAALFAFCLNKVLVPARQR